jgi:hypothetical protein
VYIDNPPELIEKVREELNLPPGTDFYDQSFEEVKE